MWGECMITIWWGWVALVTMLVTAVGFIVGAVVMRVIYQNTLTDREERLAAVLARMDTLGEFIKSEILHVEPEEPKSVKK